MRDANSDYLGIKMPSWDDAALDNRLKWLYIARAAITSIEAATQPSEGEVERVARALCERDIRAKRRFDTPADELEEMLPDSVDYNWSDYVPQARVAIAAMKGDG
jgi:hypothetical protein